MRKFASAEILSVDSGTTGRTTLLRSAHRAVFHYTPREGMIYVRSRAISSRCNDNHDLFPADEIAKSYRTFIGKPVFVNHHNDNHKRMRGLVIDAALHQDRNPDGSPDTWAEVLMEIDGFRFPRLARALINGWIDRTSMGCDVMSSKCSICANVATTPLEYCVHIPGKKGQRIVVTAADGRKEARLVYEECRGLSFFENSVLVEPPADPTAFLLGNVELGPGLQHLHAMRLDKPVETMSRAASTGTIVTELPIVPRTATRRQAPTRDDPYATITRCEGPGCRKSVRTHSDSHESNWEIGVSDNDEIPRDFCGPQCALAHMNRHPELWDRTGENPERPTEHTQHDMYRSIMQREGSRRAAQDPFRTSSQKIWAMLHQAVQEDPEHRWRPQGMKTRPQVQHIAYGETRAPQDVDTLRDEACPICGNDTAYAGRECQICGYILPIKPFGDPDVDKAKELDQLKQTVDDQLLAADPSRKGAPMPDGTDLDEAQLTGDDPASPTLACSNCSTEFRPGVPQTTDTPGEKPVDGPAEGDICPECQQGELISTGQPDDQDEELDQDADQLPGQDEQEDEDQSGNDDENGSGDGRLPAPKRRKATKDRRTQRSEGELDAMQGLQVMAAQQKLIDGQSAQIFELARLNQRQATQIERLTAAVATIARAGGEELHGQVRLAMLRKRADEQNPAQPVPEPAPQPPTMTTPQAKTPEAFADVTAPGMVPGTTNDVAADAVTTAYTPGQDIAAAPFRQLVDVTAPVEGTQGPRPINETRTEVDVRAGNTMNPQVAFPLGGPYTQQQRTTGAARPAASAPPNDMRFVSCLRLARLRIEQGIAEGEDLAIAQRIAGDSSYSQEIIDLEIGTLSSVQKAAATRQSVPAPPGLVPRPFNGVQRTVPAMASMASVGSSRHTADDDAAAIFLPDNFDA